jgi:hypothetical protein
MMYAASGALMIARFMFVGYSNTKDFSQHQVRFKTGFSDIVDEHEIKAIGIREILLKPTSTHDLKTAVRRALET